MTIRLGEIAVPAQRRVMCSVCGVAFGCDLSDACWCADETARLPMPATGTGVDCLCRNCLRVAAARANSQWRIDAVLLDMDGTLVDTERVSLASLKAAMDAFGLDGAEELGHAMIGLPGPECEAMLRERWGETFPFADFERVYMRENAELLREPLALKSGARELLDALRAANVPMAIVTSSSRATAEKHLTLGGIRDYFTHVLTRDDVVRGKPDPALYRLAAEAVGADPAYCVAIEDSGPGITAAHAAGTIPILVPDVLPATEAMRARAVAVLADLHAALAVLREKGMHTGGKAAPASLAGTGIAYRE